MPRLHRPGLKSRGARQTACVGPCAEVQPSQVQPSQAACCATRALPDVVCMAKCYQKASHCDGGAGRMARFAEVCKIARHLQSPYRPSPLHMVGDSWAHSGVPGTHCRTELMTSILSPACLALYKGTTLRQRRGPAKRAKELNSIQRLLRHFFSIRNYCFMSTTSMQSLITAAARFGSAMASRSLGAQIPSLLGLWRPLRACEAAQSLASVADASTLAWRRADAQTSAVRDTDVCLVRVPVPLLPATSNPPRFTPLIDAITSVK